MAFEYDPYFIKFFLKGNYRVSVPSSTGMDGIFLYSDKAPVFISGEYITKALEYMYTIRTGFIRDEILFTLPDWYIEQIRRDEFFRYLNHTLNAKEISPTE